MGSDGVFARLKTDLEPRRTIQEVVCGGSEAPSGHVGARCAPGRSHRPNGPGLRGRQQVSHSHQVVSRGHQVSCQPGSLHSPIPGPPKSSHRLHPPEYLLHPLANLLAHPVARMPCGATVYRRAGSLSHMRRHPTVPHSPDTLPRVVALISPQGLGMKAPLPGIVQHHRHSVTLGRARCPAHHEVRQQPVAVLHEGVAHELPA